jgi:hypothetical protein
VSQDRYTKLARGMPCMIRLPGCLDSEESVVLCHYRSISLGAGIGIKPQSWLGAWGCMHCHSIVDGRADLPSFDRDAKRLAHAEGVLRTLLALVQREEIDL